MASNVTLKIKKLDDSLPTPRYAHEGDAGLDLYSAQDVKLEPGQRALVSTGIAIAIPEGYAGFVQPRSGLAAKQGVSIVNTPGLIDSGYRGEVKVILLNTDLEDSVRISRGDRIAQLVIQEVPVVALEEVGNLDGSQRGEGGFGSSGK